MSGSVTKRMLAAYIQTAPATQWLTGMFEARPQNFHSSEEVEIDILRNDEDVSIVVQDMSAGYRMNEANEYTNKSFKPPVHKEAINLNAHELVKRTPGQNPFEDPSFQGNLIQRVFNKMNLAEMKIRRAVELQAAQILQNGTVSLTDETGAVLYTIDYKPKPAHFPTAGTAWTAGGATPIADLESLCETIRNNGQGDVDELHFGADAWRAALNNDAFKAAFESRRINLGTISPMTKNGQGGSYRGTLDIGNYQVDIWTYGGRYKNPNGGAMVQYLTPANVIARISTARLDATFGDIPNIGRILGAEGNNLLPSLPSRVSNVAGGMDLHTNVWLSKDGESLMAGIGARPLLVPTAIDSFGCLRTGA